MTAAGSSPEFRISRAIVVRVSGCLDELAKTQLERILHDLIDDQGVGDLTVDLSEADGIGPDVVGVLDAARLRAEERNGTLELRVPLKPSEALVDLAEDVATFSPLDIEGERGSS